MKNRERQRENRRCKEEKIDIRDYTGVLNPTPYFAVLNIRNGYYYAQKQKSGRKEVEMSGEHGTVRSTLWEMQGLYDYDHDFARQADPALPDGTTGKVL